MKASKTVSTMSEANKKDRYMCECGLSQCRYNFSKEYYPTKCADCGSKRPEPNSKRWSPTYTEEELKSKKKMTKEEFFKSDIWNEMPDEMRYLFAQPVVKNGEMQMVLPSWKGMNT